MNICSDYFYRSLIHFFFVGIVEIPYVYPDLNCFGCFLQMWVESAGYSRDFAERTGVGE